MVKNIVLGILTFVALITLSSYNKIVALDENVDSSWSEVQNQLKRRYDLIPNLVQTVKGYAEHERDVFSEVTMARSMVGQALKLDASKLADNAALQKQLLEASGNLTTSLGRLIAVAESYPELKANENFRQLQDELAGTENRIAVARGRAISMTMDYNRSVRQVPGVLIAAFAGLEKKEYYEADQEESRVPVVNFDSKR